MELAQRLLHIQPSATLAINAKAKQLQAEGIDIIDLSVGEPDFDTPAFIRKAANTAIKEGHTRYVPVAGVPALRKAVANKFRTENGLDATADNVVVTCGAKQAIVNAMLATLNHGDDVLIPAPYWVSYPEMSRLAEASPVILPTTQDNHFKVTAAQLRDAITPDTKMLVLNSPSNPTGMLYSKSDYAALGRVLEKHPHIWVVSDEIYEHIQWTGKPFQSFAQACPALADRTITINGVSKAYAMTGWRIGYATGPEKVIKGMTKLQSQITSCASSISQHAALAALTGDQSELAAMSRAFKQRHDLVIERLNTIPGVTAIASDGAFYAFPNVEGMMRKLGIKQDIDLCTHLLENAHVAIVPGTAFGTPGYLRISFAASEAVLEVAIGRIAKCLT